jgi:quercetin dioxygenase-like cupin family protein
MGRCIASSYLGAQAVDAREEGMTMQITAHEPYALAKDAGVSDVWLPASGGRWITKVAGEQTEGRLLQLVGSERRGAAPPLHIHRYADQTFFVLAGEVTIFLGDERIEAGAGDFVLVPRGVAVTYLVRSDQAEFLVTFAPAGMEGPSGIGLDGLFRQVGIPVVDDEAPPGPVAPDPEEFARTAALYGCEIAGPPPSLD